MSEEKTTGFLVTKAYLENEIKRLEGEIKEKRKFLDEVKNPGEVIIDLPDDMTPQLLVENIERQIVEKEQELAEVNELLAMLLKSE